MSGDEVSKGGVLSATAAWIGDRDEIEWFAGVLILLGIGLVAWNVAVAPPPSVTDAVAGGAENWAPGLLMDGVLLWVVNGILRRHERKRILSQVGSMSREFAVDATRRAREEGWLGDGSLEGRVLTRARLREADLSKGALAGVDLSFADLTGAILAWGDLRGADLTGADLSRADLRWADLTGAKLRWADLRGALLEGARLEMADTRFASVDSPRHGEPTLPGAIIGGFLDDHQVAEIRRTFELFTAPGVAPVELFYTRLFELAPETRSLFRADPAHQARKFLQTLRVVVSALHTPSRHVAMLQALGERHHGYGVSPGHYALVGRAMVDTMADTLGSAFTPEARSAWERAFHLMATIMTGGASDAAAVSATGPAMHRDAATPVRATA
jgi:hemoglobin-like flavoprotein